MKKFLKLLALLFVIVPCAMIFVACTGAGDPDNKDPSKNPGGDDPSTPSQIELTTEAKTSIMTAFKSAFNTYSNSDFLSEISKHTENTSVTLNNEPIEDAGFNQVCLIKKTINNSTDEGAQRTYILENENDTTGTPYSPMVWVEKEEGTGKYIEYYQYIITQEDNLDYYEYLKEELISKGLIPENHEGPLTTYNVSYTDKYFINDVVFSFSSGYASFEDAMESPITILSSVDTFDELIESFEYFIEFTTFESFKNSLGLDELDIVITPSATKVGDVYTLTFSINVEDLEGSMKMEDGMPAVDMLYDMNILYDFKFSDTEVKEYDTYFSIDGLGDIEVAPGVSMGLGMNIEMVNKTAVDTTATTHESIMLSSDEKEEIINYLTVMEKDIEQGYTSYYVIIPELSDYMVYYNIQIGASLDDITENFIWNFSIDDERYDAINVTWYTDEECQTLADPELIVHSRGIRLYAKIEVAEGYALINEYVPKDTGLNVQEPGRNFNMFTLIDVTSVTQFTVNYETYFENACYNKDDYTFEYTSVKIDGMTQVDNYTFELESQGIYIIEYIGTVTLKTGE